MTCHLKELGGRCIATWVAWMYFGAGEVMEKAGKAFTDTGKVGKKFNPDHPEGTAGTLRISIHLYTHIFRVLPFIHAPFINAGKEAQKQGGFPKLLMSSKGAKDDTLICKVSCRQGG